MTTPLLAMEELQEASPLAHIIANTNFRILEAHTKHVLTDRVLSAPPGSPAESSVYFVDPTGTGVWAGHDDEIGVYIQGAWHWFGEPSTGERWYDATAGAWVQWTGSAWTVI